MINFMELALTHMKMDKFMLVNGKMAKKRALGKLLGLQGTVHTVHLKMI